MGVYRHDDHRLLEWWAGLPWFTKYVLQVGVLGMALLFMLVTGDFRRLKRWGSLR